MKTYEELLKFMGEWMYHNQMGGGQSHARPSADEVIAFIYGKNPSREEILSESLHVGVSRGWK